jgi:thiamine biosynthesis lipoprotein
MEAEQVFDVMGTTARVIVTADRDPEPLADRAAERLHDLEARWSRFRADSEVSRMNELAAHPVVVSRDTYTLVELAVRGWHLTDGRFDPTLLPELQAAGYDRSFELVGASRAPDVRSPAHAAPFAPHELEHARDRRAAARIELDPIVGAVTLGEGVAFDPGGIGKGLAADLVVDELLRAGARGALVSVGGDVRAEGDAPEGEGWVIAIADPLQPERFLRFLHLERGAVASTWRTRRAWTAPDGTPRHHLIDPVTLMPADSALAGVAVVAGEGWLAEVLAKAAFLAGPDDGATFVEAQGAAALLVDNDGVEHEAGDFVRFS